MTDLHATAAVVERVLPATPDEVFNEWVDPDALADWMCPRPAHATKIELDARVGGSLRIDIEEGDARLSVAGTYLQVAPPRLLQFTWSCSTWEDPTLESIVTVTLEPYGRLETLMIIHHALLPPEHVTNHAQGWTVIARQLGEVLPRRPSEPSRRRR
jgi:uncharacterized protein YndB with AHSA1/START domain